MKPTSTTASAKSKSPCSRWTTNLYQRWFVSRNQSSTLTCWTATSSQL